MVIPSFFKKIINGYAFSFNMHIGCLISFLKTEFELPIQGVVKKQFSSQCFILKKGYEG